MASAGDQEEDCSAPGPALWGGSLGLLRKATTPVLGAGRHSNVSLNAPTAGDNSSCSISTTCEGGIKTRNAEVKSSPTNRNRKSQPQEVSFK